MLASPADNDHLDRTACRLLFTYGGEAALVAYIKAVHCESAERLREARRWRDVLGRIVAIDAVLRPIGHRERAGEAGSAAAGSTGVSPGAWASPKRRLAS